jgi:hypothetical protein
MRKLGFSEWASVAEVVGALGVIASLMFVAFSVAKNTDEAIASRTGTLYDTARQIELTIASDPEWAATIIRGRDTEQQLSKVEEYRYDAYVVAVLDLWDEMLLRNEDGLIENDLLVDWDSYFTDWAGRHVTEAAWARVEWNYIGGGLRGKVEVAMAEASRD